MTKRAPMSGGRLFCACLLLALCGATRAVAQKKVLSYPFEFEKNFLAKGDYDCYFLDNQGDNNFSLVLKDNKKIEYILVGSDFKVINKFGADIGSTVFDTKGLKDCTGGTANHHQFNFVYPQSKTVFDMETVDFDAKTSSHKMLFELASNEKNLVSFSDNNTFFELATNTKNKSLSLSMMNAAGTLVQKSFPFPIPEHASKNRNDVGEYLAGLKVIKGNEFPDLSIAVKPAKLFTRPDKLVMVMNDGDNPAHIVTISLPDLTMSEKMIEYSSLIGADEKGKIYVSSYYRDGRLYSLILNKKNIRIVINDVESGAQLGKLEINDDLALDMFADGPTTEKRLGKREEGKPVDDVKKLIKLFTRGTEGLMVSENAKGQLIVTVGTYDMIQMSSGGSSGPAWQGGYMPSNSATGPAMVYNSFMYYRPGIPSYTTTDARYYNTTFFKVLLDPKSFKITRGRVPMAAADQIKDYIDTIDKKAKAKNQFAIGKTQYYGYYDRDMLSYVVEQIRLIQ